MKARPHVLTITGSDSTGGSGIQADIKTITALRGVAVSAITAVTVQTSAGIERMHNLPTELVVGQVKAIIADVHPHAIKVGLIDDAQTIVDISTEIMGCRNIVCDPGIVTSSGKRLMGERSIRALCTKIFPLTKLLVLKCTEAEVILHCEINTREDMIEAAKKLLDFGVQNVLLRGGHMYEDRVTALLHGVDGHEFFASDNIDGWQRHGVGGALSSAITTCLGFSDSLTAAIKHAHDYMHSRVVYTVEKSERFLRPSDIYNDFLSLLMQHYKREHTVGFYADKMSITTRYLGEITKKVSNKSPKEIISDHLTDEAQSLLDNTRMTIQEISNELGFSSQMQFCRFYHKQTGISPSDSR